MKYRASLKGMELTKGSINQTMFTNGALKLKKEEYETKTKLENDIQFEIQA